MEQQNTHHLKSNSKFWSFVGKIPRFRGREAPWLPSIQIEVKKPFGRRNSILRYRTLSIAPSFEVEKPLGYLPFILR